MNNLYGLFKMIKERDTLWLNSRIYTVDTPMNNLYSKFVDGVCANLWKTRNGIWNSESFEYLLRSS